MATAELFIAMNEAGDLDAGIGQEEAQRRLRENCGGNLARVAKVIVHMTPPLVEDGGEAVIPNVIGATTVIPANDH